MFRLFEGDLLGFRGSSAKVRSTLKDAKEQQLSYEVWTDLGFVGG